MGLLPLNRLMSMRRDRRRRPIQSRNESVTSAAKRKDSPCRQDDNSRSDKKLRYSGQSLPEDIWHHIHSLLPLRDAARVACVSHSFRHSWRCYPNLYITRKTLGLEDEMSSSFKISSVLAYITNQILKERSRIGVKALKLEIPSLLQRLSHLVVNDCKNLKVIESRAPNLYSFRYGGALIRLSLGDSLQNFKLFRSPWGVFHYSCKNHPHMLQNLEDLDISTYVGDTLVVPVPGKFLHLRKLCFGFISPDYDYLSLVPFLDACPSLETFMLFVEPVAMEQESVLGDSSADLRQMPGHLHRSIKDVQIIGFCSAKSMVELTCHILENAKSLQCLTLSTFVHGGIFCSSSKTGKCLLMSRERIMEAHKALLVMQRYIVEKVPSSVELKVVKPCSQCNPLKI
ncbi:hypothetical protein ACQ4PT_026022 [Festuca glaucescens]